MSKRKNITNLHSVYDGAMADEKWNNLEKFEFLIYLISVIAKNWKKPSEEMTFILVEV